jgi:eukaryotic-like serine/threonine-protein kinase
VAERGPLPLDEALRIVKGVADALAFAHRKGIVHRDIKPENVLLQAGHALVADFGIARALSLAGDATLTRTGMVLGTPLYMSPEQTVGDVAVDGRSDIYSLGCVLFEALAGSPPFRGSTPADVARRRLTEAAPRLRTSTPAVPAAIDEAVARALAREPGERFATAEEFAGALSPPGGAAGTVVAGHPGAVAGEAPAGPATKGGLRDPGGDLAEDRRSAARAVDRHGGAEGGGASHRQCGRLRLLPAGAP